MLGRSGSCHPWIWVHVNSSFSASRTGGEGAWVISKEDFSFEDYDFMPPPTPVFPSPTEIPEHDSATFAMEIDSERSGSQSSTDNSYKAPDKKSIQPTDYDRVTKTMIAGCDLTKCLPRPGARTAESPSPLQRFLNEDEKEGGVPSLVQHSILPNAAARLYEPFTRANRGLWGGNCSVLVHVRDGRIKRRRRARRASSVYVENEPLSVRDRLERDFGE